MSRSEGEIRTREYTKDAVKRTTTEVRVLNISKLDRPPKTEAADA